MFTIETRIKKSYELSARRRALHDFFVESENFSRYMPDIVADVRKQSDDRSVWTLNIDVSGSSLEVKIDMTTKDLSEGEISHVPVASSDDRLAFHIVMDEKGDGTSLSLTLELSLERESSFDIHPLAGILGERSINKIVKSHAEEYVDQFVGKAESEAGGKRTKKK